MMTRSAWVGEPRGDLRVLRGGPFDGTVRDASRSRNFPGGRGGNNVGFRVVVSQFSYGEVWTD